MDMTEQKRQTQVTQSTERSSQPKFLQDQHPGYPVDVTDVTEERSPTSAVDRDDEDDGVGNSSAIREESRSVGFARSGSGSCSERETNESRDQTKQLNDDDFNARSS